jgi:hypothetical protein
MSNSRRKSSWTVLTILASALVVSFVVYRLFHLQAIVLRGAVTSRNSDPHKELPIGSVLVTVTDNKGTRVLPSVTQTKSAADDPLAPPIASDATGFFSIKLPREVRHGHAITLHFRHSDYQPLDLKDFVGDQLYVVHLVPLHPPTPPTNTAATVVSNVRVRYSIKNMTSATVGSAVKAFDVENIGNVPCTAQPCSPDGRWKAAVGSATIDAGSGNEFRNVRVSCIAGPCPFTRIETDSLSNNRQIVTATARTWSDTATFLMEAEVFHPMVAQVVHESYPTIFGPTLNFTLPTGAEGISMEADLNGQTIIFPLGPNLFLSWATCNSRTNPDQTRVYRCELKPSYRF